VTATDLAALLPLLILAYGATALLVGGAFWRNHAGVASIAAVLLALSFGAALAVLPLAPRQVTALLRVDALTLFFQALLALGGLALALLSVDYLATSPLGRERYYVLLLFAVSGMGVLVGSTHFASFFLGLETVSVSLFGLIGFALRRPASQEAGIKYLVLAGTSLSFLLLGMAFLYFQYGTMQFAALAAAPPPSLLVFLGLGLILVGFAYKLALAPFHMWAPDVYQGAPAPVTALVATGSKAAMFALLLRFTPVFLGRDQGELFTALTVLAILTMFTGNLLALLQRNLKRLLAYSSVAHMGYLLIPLLAGGAIGTASLSFYFVSYFITTIAAFGVVAALSQGSEEVEDLEDYRGLGFARPVLAATLALAMVSLAGIPLTVGFMAKFYIFSAAAQARLWLLLVVGVANSGLSAYYYLRVLAALYSRPAPARTWRPVRPASAVTLTVLSAALVVLGIYPAPLIGLTQRMAAAWRGGGGAASLTRVVQPEQLAQRVGERRVGGAVAGVAEGGNGAVEELAHEEVGGVFEGRGGLAGGDRPIISELPARPAEALLTHLLGGGAELGDERFGLVIAAGE
jgi:NADH-quinone oxidoreductase subunit N